MNLQDLRYFVAVAEHRHFGHAAAACHVSQPTLSGQVRKLEEELGASLFERSNKHVTLTAVGKTALQYAKEALERVDLVRSIAEASRDQLAGPLRVGVIPTLAPYIMPSVIRELRRCCPKMKIELWEDQTKALLEFISNRELDAALIATEVPEGHLTSLSLFVEPFLAALPRSHRLATKARIDEKEMTADVLVLSEGHCLADQTLMACGRKELGNQPLHAASLSTLIELVAEAYGTTLVPKLAAAKISNPNIVLKPLMGGSSRTIRLVSRPTFTRPQALKALEKAVRKAAGSRNKS